MNTRPRYATFSVLLLFTACFLFRPLQATDERAAGRPLAESLPAHNSTRLQLAAQPGRSASQESPANETGPLFPVEEHGKWGYMDKAGKIVISPKYYDAYPFIEGLALVQPFQVLLSKAIRVLIIDKTGNTVGPSIYSHAQDFSEGLALVVPAGEEKWGFGYIDKTGKMVISQEYNEAKSFKEGLAAVAVGGKWGYIDKTGQMVIPPRFSEAYRFSDGLATVKDGGRRAPVTTGVEWSCMDRTGQMVSPTQFSDTFGRSEGLVNLEVGKKWGYI